MNIFQSSHQRELRELSIEDKLWQKNNECERENTYVIYRGIVDVCVLYYMENWNEYMAKCVLLLPVKWMKLNNKKPKINFVWIEKNLFYPLLFAKKMIYYWIKMINNGRRWGLLHYRHDFCKQKTNNNQVQFTCGIESFS